MTSTHPFLGCTCYADGDGSVWRASFVPSSGARVTVPGLYKTRAEALQAACEAVRKVFGTADTSRKLHRLAAADEQDAQVYADARRAARTRHALSHAAP